MGPWGFSTKAMYEFNELINSKECNKEAYNFYFIVIFNII